MTINDSVEEVNGMDNKKGIIEVMVEGEGMADVEIIRIQRGDAAQAIVIAVAARVGLPVHGAALFIEDSDVPIDLSVIILEERVAGKIHHVHRTHQIEVGVFYQGQKIHRRFAPSARIQRVLEWAVSPEGFRIDPAIAPEMELALHGHTATLPKNAHIGRYICHPHHKLDFDLIRGIVPNGALL